MYMTFRSYLALKSENLIFFVKIYQNAAPSLQNHIESIPIFAKNEDRAQF